MGNDALIGQQIGAYTVQSKLGEGGMAVVYKAYHARLRREVAIKLILSQIAQQPDFRARFEREAQLVASLQHPNIVAVYDFGDFGSQSYLVMQYVGGGTLRDRLRGGRALDPRLAALYAIQMGRALHHAHMRGIVHRDVKPQNMLISSSDPNQLLLSDFGIAKLYDNRHEPTLVNMAGSQAVKDPTLTSVDQIVGTAEYMAPEQINGEPVDARTDVYALGVVLFQMLTGEAPFQSTTVQGLLFQHVHAAPRPIREINPYVSETLAYIVARALAKAPAARFQSAEEMAQALEAANVNATYRLGPSQPLAPGGFGVPAQGDAPTSPSLNRASLYGQPSQVNAPGVASSYGPQPAVTNTPPSGVSARVTHPSGAGTLRRPARRQPLSYAISAIVLLLALVLVLARTGVLPFFGGGSGGTSNPAQPFTENFKDNSRNWPLGNVNAGLTASLTSGGYSLVTDSSNQTYFPHASLGTLPDNFTLQVTLQQSSATGNTFGLAFHLSENGSSVSCYAFVINASGHYELLKYDPTAQQQEYQIYQGSSSAIHQGPNSSNLLEVSAQGNNYSFKINGQPVAVGSANSTSYTDASNPYSGGELAILIAGPSTSILVTSVQLAIP